MLINYQDHEIQIENVDGGILVIINGNAVYESSRQ